MENTFESFDFFHIKKILDSGLIDIRNIKSGKIPSLKSSIGGENKATGGFFPTDQVIILGDDGIGVSSRVLALIDDFINKDINPYYADKIVVLYNSWANAGWRDALRVLSLKSKQTVSDLLDINDIDIENSMKNLETLANKYSDIPIYINNKPTTGRGWETNTKTICKGYEGEKLVINVIDNTRLLTRVNYTNEESLISDFLYLAQDVKNRYKTINIIVSPLKRDGFSSKGQSLGAKIPTKLDILASPAVFTSSDIVLMCHRPGFYGDKEFRYGDTIVDTGLTNYTEKDDDLWVEDLLKNKYAAPQTIFLKHSIKNGRFEQFTGTERAKKFTTKARTISSNDY